MVALDSRYEALIYCHGDPRGGILDLAPRDSLEGSVVSDTVRPDGSQVHALSAVSDLCCSHSCPGSTDQTPESLGDLFQVCLLPLPR